MCTDTFKHSNVAKGDMIRCCICMLWVHAECVPDDKNRRHLDLQRMPANALKNSRNKGDDGAHGN